MYVGPAAKREGTKNHADDNSNKADNFYVK